jgi:DNA-binding transcriptional MerR regulator
VKSQRLLHYLYVNVNSERKNKPAAGNGIMSKTYSITELSREFDITTRTIRFYEDEGLLAPRREGQKRIYSPKDRVLLKLILRGKRLGFTLAESRKLFEMYDPASGNRQQLQTMLDTLDDKEALLDQQLNDIHVMKIELQEARERCQAAMNGINPQSSEE